MSLRNAARRFGKRAKASLAAAAGGGGGGGGSLAADTFDRVAGPLVTASDGGMWTTIGTWTTNGTQASSAAAAATAVRDAGQSDYTMSVKVVDADTANAGLLWRYTDADNCFSFQRSGPTEWYVRSRVAGVDTNYFADVVTIADGDIITVELSGTSHIVKRNGADDPHQDVHRVADWDQVWPGDTPGTPGHGRLRRLRRGRPGRRWRRPHVVGRGHVRPRRRRAGHRLGRRDVDHTRGVEHRRHAGDVCGIRRHGGACRRPVRLHDVRAGRGR
jgi:hypothetical protein